MLRFPPSIDKKVQDSHFLQLRIAKCDVEEWFSRNARHALEQGTICACPFVRSDHLRLSGSVRVPLSPLGCPWRVWTPVDARTFILSTSGLGAASSSRSRGSWASAHADACVDGAEAERKDIARSGTAEMAGVGACGGLQCVSVEREYDSCLLVLLDPFCTAKLKLTALPDDAGTDSDAVSASPTAARPPLAFSLSLDAFCLFTLPLDAPFLAQRSWASMAAPTTAPAPHSTAHTQTHTHTHTHEPLFLSAAELKPSLSFGLLPQGVVCTWSEAGDFQDALDVSVLLHQALSASLASSASSALALASSASPPVRYAVSITAASVAPPTGAMDSVSSGSALVPASAHTHSANAPFLGLCVCPDLTSMAVVTAQHIFLVHLHVNISSLLSLASPSPFRSSASAVRSRVPGSAVAASGGLAAIDEAGGGGGSAAVGPSASAPAPAPTIAETPPLPARADARTHAASGTGGGAVSVGEREREELLDDCDRDRDHDLVEELLFRTLRSRLRTAPRLRSPLSVSASPSSPLSAFSTPRIPPQPQPHSAQLSSRSHVSSQSPLTPMTPTAPMAGRVPLSSRLSTPRATPRDAVGGSLSQMEATVLAKSAVVVSIPALAGGATTRLLLWFAHFSLHFQLVPADAEAHSHRSAPARKGRGRAAGLLGRGPLAPPAPSAPLFRTVFFLTSAPAGAVGSHTFPSVFAPVAFASDAVRHPHHAPHFLTERGLFLLVARQSPLQVLRNLLIFDAHPSATAAAAAASTAAHAPPSASASASAASPLAAHAAHSPPAAHSSRSSQATLHTHLSLGPLCAANGTAMSCAVLHCCTNSGSRDRPRAFCVCDDDDDACTVCMRVCVCVCCVVLSRLVCDYGCLGMRTALWLSLSRCGFCRVGSADRADWRLEVGLAISRARSHPTGAAGTPVHGSPLPLR